MPNHIQHQQDVSTQGRRQQLFLPTYSSLDGTIRAMSTNPETQTGTWTDFKNNRAKGIIACRDSPDALSVHTDEAGNIPMQPATTRWPQLIRGTQSMDSLHGWTTGYWWKEPTLGWSWTSDDNGIIAMAIRADKAFASLPRETCIAWVLNMALVPPTRRTEFLEDAQLNQYTGEFLTELIHQRWGKSFPIPKNLVPKTNNYVTMTDQDRTRPWHQHLQETHIADIPNVSDRDAIREILEKDKEAVMAWLSTRQQDQESDEDTHNRRDFGPRTQKRSRPDAPYHRDPHRNTPAAVQHRIDQRDLGHYDHFDTPGPISRLQQLQPLDHFLSMTNIQASAARASTDPAPNQIEDPEFWK
jgi:hypothetical protein